MVLRLNASLRLKWASAAQHVQFISQCCICLIDLNWSVPISLASSTLQYHLVWLGLIKPPISSAEKSLPYLVLIMVASSPSKQQSSTWFANAVCCIRTCVCELLMSCKIVNTLCLQAGSLSFDFTFGDGRAIACPCAVDPKFCQERYICV